MHRIGSCRPYSGRDVSRDYGRTRREAQSKLQFSDDDVNDTVADLLTFNSLVKITGTLHVVPADPDDDKILECAALGNATHVVSGDKRHLLPLGQFQGITIVSPADFIRLNRASSP